MISELQAVKPRFVLLYPNPDFYEPNESMISSGVTLLNDFIRSNYENARTFGGITVLQIRHKKS